MAAPVKLTRFATRVRNEGLSHALLVAMHRAYSALWERRLGIHTSEAYLLANEGLSHPDHHDYSPTSYLDLTRALRVAAPQPNQHVFIDMGSGMGRAVLMAASRPFRRVIGVEALAEADPTRQADLEIARPRLRCRNVEFFAANAMTYALPEDVTLIYLYNPFGDRSWREWSRTSADRSMPRLAGSRSCAPRRRASRRRSGHGLAGPTRRVHGASAPRHLRLSSARRGVT